jgi:hypothetical protein
MDVFVLTYDSYEMHDHRVVGVFTTMEAAEIWIQSQQLSWKRVEKPLGTKNPLWVRGRENFERYLELETHPLKSL